MEREFRRAVAQARQRGQAVFLSSHKLAEVEAVCDRVGILRAGRLVEIASVAGLRRLHRTEVEARFAGAVPDLADIPGVDAVETVTVVGGDRHGPGRGGAARRRDRRDRGLLRRYGRDGGPDVPDPGGGARGGHGVARGRPAGADGRRRRRRAVVASVAEPFGLL